MLLPALAKAKQKAHAISCLNNLKQLSMAFHAALEDMAWRFDEDAFSNRSTGSSAYADNAWWWQRHYFANVDALMLCPSTSEPRQRSGDTPGTADRPWRNDPLSGSGRTKPYRGSFAQNFYFYPQSPEGWWLSRSGGDVLHLAYRTEGAIESPVRTPTFSDSVYKGCLPLPTDKPATDLYVGSPTPEMSSLTIARHGGPGLARATKRIDIAHPLPQYRNNIVFFDGHAEPIPLEGLWQLNWHRGWKAPAKRPGL